MREPEKAIRKYFRSNNETPQPFTRVASANKIPKKVRKNNRTLETSRRAALALVQRASWRRRIEYQPPRPSPAASRARAQPLSAGTEDGVDGGVASEPAAEKKSATV